MASDSVSARHGTEIAVTVLSTLGAVLWSIQLLPQIWLNYKRKSGAGLQPSMMLAWAMAGVPLAIHNILGRQPIALQVQAQILTGLSLLTWSQVMYYDHKWAMRKCVLCLSLSALALAAVQAAFIVGFRYGTDDEHLRRRVVLSMAILAGVGLALGVLRQHYDVYRHRTVRGIAWGFVILDAAGDLASLLSVVITSPADRVAAAIYASELGLWILMMLAGIVFRLRSYLQDRAAQDDQHGEEGGERSPRPRRADDVSDTASISSSAFNRIRPTDSNRSSLHMRRLGAR